MRVFIDGKEVNVDMAKFNNAKEFFAYCKEGLCSGTAMIYKIEADGKEIVLGDFYTRPLKKMETIKFFTKPKDQLLRDALKEIAVSLPGLAKDISSIVKSLRSGQDKQALEDYLKIMPLLNAVILGARSVEIGMSYDFKLDYPSLIECLHKINQAYEDKDYVLLADSLEYLLLPWFKTMMEIIAPRAK